jgi:hypothetical protein
MDPREERAFDVSNDPLIGRRATTWVIGGLIVFFLLNLGLILWFEMGPGSTIASVESAIEEIQVINATETQAILALQQSGLFDIVDIRDDGTVTGTILESYEVPPEVYDTQVVLTFSLEGYCIGRVISHRVHQ